MKKRVLGATFFLLAFLVTSAWGQKIEEQRWIERGHVARGPIERKDPLTLSDGTRLRIADILVVRENQGSYSAPVPAIVVLEEKTWKKSGWKKFPEGAEVLIRGFRKIDGRGISIDSWLTAEELKLDDRVVDAALILKGNSPSPDP